jgi:DNA uptake protein ComE-like DNA-binding protein
VQQEELLTFENNYYLSLIHRNKPKINEHLKRIDFNRPSLDFESLVKMHFEDLLELRPKIKAYSDSKKQLLKGSGEKLIITNEFDELFDYKANQPKLANFFMNQKIFNLKTCHYCSIDFINAFKDISDYQSGLDFINEADENELQYINGIDKALAKKIIKKRRNKKYFSINELQVSQAIKDEITRFELKDSHNHFTLDHIIPQNSHKFYSLCLYNIVPACYSCNSKFKRANEFKLNDDLKFITPTSESYTLNKDFHFKIFFQKRIENIKSEYDFNLDAEITNNQEHIQTYLRTFKILGRYAFHKNQIIRLIEKKVKYSDSRIKELSKQTGLSEDELKRLVFGEELFDKDLSNEPLVKFKRDIAENINIEGVIK